MKNCFSLQIYMNYYLYINEIKGKIYLNNELIYNDNYYSIYGNDNLNFYKEENVRLKLWFTLNFGKGIINYEKFTYEEDDDSNDEEEDDSNNYNEEDGNSNNEKNINWIYEEVRKIIIKIDIKLADYPVPSVLIFAIDKKWNILNIPSYTNINVERLIVNTIVIRKRISIKSKIN